MSRYHPFVEWYELGYSEMDALMRDQYPISNLGAGAFVQSFSPNLYIAPGGIEGYWQESNDGVTWTNLVHIRVVALAIASCTIHSQARYVRFHRVDTQQSCCKIGVVQAIEHSVQQVVGPTVPAVSV